MFVLHHAIHSTALVANLIQLIQQQPLKNCFEKEIILIQNQNMETWLSQQCAQSFKIWAHYQCLSLTTFFKQLAKKIATPAVFSIAENTVFGGVMKQLYQLDDPVYSPLKQYLNGSDVGLKRYQLAQKITQIFNDYQRCRPELLEYWQQSDDVPKNSIEAWQYALWRQLTRPLNGEAQFYSPQAVIHHLIQAPVGTFSYQIPQRIFVFGLHHLSSWSLDYLNALSHHCDVHFYLQTPMKMNQQTNTSLLIRNLGQQGRAFQQQLRQTVTFYTDEIVYKTPQYKNNLQQLHYDLTHFPAKSMALTMDGSITVHSCHSKVREIEVLKNLLLASIDAHPTLTWGDISVIAPDMNRYRPFITAIFDEIPHHIDGGKTSLDDVVLNAFFQFLQLIPSRFEWQPIFDLLAVPAIATTFDLSITDLDHLKTWLMATEVRWGKSPTHKQHMGLPPLNANTWQASLERLLMGYALGTDDNFVDGILPYCHLEGSSTQALGGLNDFMQLLFKASKELIHAKKPHEWHGVLIDYATLLFGDHPLIQTLEQVLIHFEEKLKSIAEHELELKVMIHGLHDALKMAIPEHTDLLRGDLTFSSIAASQGIPFKVVAMLGMNEGDFPSIDHKLHFDLLAMTPQPNDFSKRTDDRQQFLDILLNTKQQLILSYLGQSPMQNDTIPPSVVVSELLEVMAHDYQLFNLLTHHPLQPFSETYFNPVNPLSYSITDLEVAKSLSQPSSQVATWWQGKLATEDITVLKLVDIRRFYQHPQRYFMRHQLGINYQPLKLTIEPHEPFVMDALARYTLQHEWIECLLNQQPFSLKKLQAQGRWLSGVLGGVEFNRQQPDMMNFAAHIQALKLGKPLETFTIDLQVGGYQLTGELEHRYQQGSLFYRYAPLKGKDLILAWLHHCVINQYESQFTYLISKDEQFIFKNQHQGLEPLTQLLDIYQRGRLNPTVLLVDIALDYVQQATHLVRSHRRQKPALQVAIDQLKRRLETNYELEFQRLYGKTDLIIPLFSPDFILFCEQFLKPLWISLTKNQLMNSRHLK